MVFVDFFQIKPGKNFTLLKSYQELMNFSRPTDYMNLTTEQLKIAPESKQRIENLTSLFSEL